MATAALDTQAIENGLATLAGWQRDGGAITKTYTFDSYVAGLAFATAVGVVCDGLNHHPDLTIGWKKVTVIFTTHDAGSQITQHDLDAAQAVERLGYPKRQD